MSRRRLALVALALLVAVLPSVLDAAPAGARSGAVAMAPPSSRWSWPLEVRPVLRSYAAPLTPYGAGHRGLDLAAAPGDLVRSPADGIVRFAGQVGLRTALTIDHGGGVISTLEPVVPLVAVGDAVARGQPVATVAPTAGHCPTECLHLGARLDGRYLSPLVLLGGVPRAVLLPLGDQARG